MHFVMKEKDTMKKQPIGFMDSGVGGLTLVKEAAKRSQMKTWCLLVIKHDYLTAKSRLPQYANLLGRC